MKNSIKRSTAITLASLTLATSLPVSAAESKPSINANTKITSAQKLNSKNSDSTLTAIKNTITQQWSKTPKPVKTLSKIALISAPIVIGGVVIYNIPAVKNTIKFKIEVQEYKAIFRKLETENIEFQKKCAIHPTEFNKLLVGLTTINPYNPMNGGVFQQCLVIGYSYKPCSTMIDLLQTPSEELDKKINALNIDVVFGLSQMVQLLKTATTQQFIELGGLTLQGWAEQVLSPKIAKKLQELNQKTLKKYNLTIQKHLGSGQSGEVYLCTDKDGNQVAVKIIPENGGLTSKISIKNEKGVWKLLTDIESDNIVKYKKPQFTKNKTVGFSMEYVDGAKDLASIAPKNTNEALDWSKQLFSGLEALHSKKISHRDIKLENILLTANGRIKICDFGLAKNQISANTICGTAAMMAPEIRKHFGSAMKTPNKYDGTKADVYSAALVVYCLMFDKKTIDLENVKIDDSITSKTVDRFGNPIGEDMSKFFEKCLDKNPNTRATATEALQLLNGLD